MVAEFRSGEGWAGEVEPRAGAGQRYLLKVLHPGYDLSEASLLASLEHPRVPRVVETGRTVDGRTFLLREFLAGRPLGECFPETVAGVLDLATQLLETLAFVHMRGILHHDIKPSNVLVCEVDGAPSYILLDFGLGVRSGDRSDGGTPFFAAPERLLGLAADARSDLFSLGALIYCALQRSAAPTPVRRFLARFPKEGFFAAVEDRAETLPAPFDRVLPRLVARQPEHRFPDAEEALEALAGRSGRPAVSLLRPDPIALHAETLRRFVRGMRSGAILRLQGEDDRVRRSLAVHAAVETGETVRVDASDGDSSDGDASDGDASHGDASDGEAGLATEPIVDVFVIPMLTVEQVASHLVAAVSLDPGAARLAAGRVVEGGGTSIAAVARILHELTVAGRIVPDGMRWIWPDAVSGRLQVLQAGAATPIDPADPSELQDLAARGQVQAAIEGFRRMVSRHPESDDRPWRSALARGLIQGGEPARALPFVADLPVHHARALLDLGRPVDARGRLTAAGPRSAQEMCTSDLERRRVLACIEHISGDSERALETLGPPGDAADPEGVIVRSQILLGLGRVEEADATLTGVLDATDGRPFLQAAAWTSRAEYQRAQGDLDGAEASYTRAHTLLLACGHVRHSATAATNLGVIAKDLGRHQEAIALQRQARAMYEHVGDERGVALAVANLGLANLAMGDAVGALRRLQDARERFGALGVHQHDELLSDRLAAAERRVGGNDPAPSPAPRQAHDEVTMPIGSSDSRAISKEVFRTFLAVNRRLASEANLERAMNYLLEAAVTLTGGRSGYLLVGRGESLRKEFQCGEYDDVAAAFSRSMVNRATQQRRTVSAEDAVADRDLMDMASVRNLRQRSAVCAPFRTAAGTQGALYVEHPSRSGVFGDAEKEHLEILADQAAIAVDRMLAEEAVADELARSKRELVVVRRALPRGGVEMLGKSPPVVALRQQIEKVGASELAVLITGETGSGKELVARGLHQASPRTKGPFVAENCSAIPHELMEREFFGHRKGAFTGADEDRAGLLEMASGGTLFLDEIADMSAALQAKLLRALQESTLR